MNSHATPPADLARHARSLLIKTMTVYRDDPRTSAWLRERLERLEQPLRIAITGRVNSGKSALINALVGQDLAPTDPQERTQISTTYRYGRVPRVTVHTAQGGVEEIPVSGIDANTVRDLQQWRPDQAARLVVEAPAAGLQGVTLVETTGVVSAAAKETARTALAQVLAESDAQLYLSRQIHQADLQFLRSLHEQPIARAAPVSTIVGLARADESGSGAGLDAAEEAARGYRDDPKVRAFAQHVVPVVGVLAAGARTLTAQEVAALGELAALSASERDELLLSGDRVTRRETATSSEVRARLLEKLGLFGLRRAVALVSEGADEVAKLVPRLLEESRVNDLQEAVHTQLVENQGTLRARSVLLAVDMVLRAQPRAGSQQIRVEFERIVANAHDFDELRVLSAVRSGQVRFPDRYGAEAERLLGARGQDPPSRLGCGPQASHRELAERGGEILERWRELATTPNADRFRRSLARTVLRSCERLLAQLLV